MRAPTTDLRLVPAAIACWAAGLAGVRLDPSAAVLGGALCGAAAVAVAVAAHRPLPGAAPTAAPGAAAGGDRDQTPPPPGTAAAVGGRHVGAPGPPSSVPLAAGHLVLVLLICAATLSSAAAQGRVRQAGLLAPLAAEAGSVRVVGTVRSSAVPLRARSTWRADEDRYRVDLLVHRVQGGGRVGPAAAPVLVLAPGSWQGVPYGARVEAVGRLEPTAPGDAAIALLVVRGPPSLVDAPAGVHRRVATVRRALLRVSDRLPPDQRGLVPGAAIGDTTRVPDDLDAAMRTAGLTHVTAVSGAHFVVVGGVVLGLTALAGLPRAARAGVVAVAMGGFVLLVHPSPSVLRAAVMGGVGVWALVLGRPARSLPALATCVVVLVVLDPWWAGSIGFALSVAATGGIVLLSGPLTRGLTAALPERAARVVAVPLAAQCACGPLLLTLSTGLSTYAVPANVAAAPALVPATVMGVLAAVLAPWWPHAGAASATVAGWATAWVAEVARTVAGLPASRLPWPSGPAGVALLVVATSGAVLALTRLRRPGGRRSAADEPVAADEPRPRSREQLR